MRTALLVYNPVAGRYPSRLLAERAANLLRRHGWEISIQQTQSGEHISELAKQAAAEEMQAFFVVGGDGSINRAIIGLLGAKTALGVLPAGTSNVWAKELGLPGLSWTRWRALEESALRLADARTYQVDIGVCNERPFLLWAGAGLDGFIVNRLEPRPAWEKRFSIASYSAKAVWNASQWHGINLKAETDDHVTEGRYLMALVSNVHLYAGGIARLARRVSLNDGLLDLWLFKGDSMVDTLQAAFNLLSGRHINSQQVEKLSFTNLLLTSQTTLFIQLDGEPYRCEREAHIAVRPGELHVLMPQKIPYPLISEGSI
jgi:YegS/Rv2252/BmrU family lipid kinase